VVHAIGKAAFDASGYYSELESLAAALRSNDCAEAATRDQNLVQAGKDFATDMHDLKAALDAVPVP
jgi:hypothetical protein